MSLVSKTDRESIEPASVVNHPWKSTMDWFLAAFLMFPAAPVILAAMALVRLTSPGPAIYRQTRLGRGGRSFTIYKIRTMHHNSERLTGPRWSTPGDPRVTRLGRILRATHLDELPQLWNIFRGDMSLVGPRPERPEIVPQLERVLPAYRERLLVRPGVTGLAQVQLPPDTDVESVRRKLACDLYYISRAGIWLDLRIMIGTALGLMSVPVKIRCGLLGIPRVECAEREYLDQSGEMNTLPGPSDRFAPISSASRAF